MTSETYRWVCKDACRIVALVNLTLVAVTSLFVWGMTEANTKTRRWFVPYSAIFTFFNVSVMTHICRTARNRNDTSCFEKRTRFVLRRTPTSAVGAVGRQPSLPPSNSSVIFSV